MSEAKHIICPVCGKVDIPDYHKEDVVCPSCGSDLSVYRMLYEFQKGESKVKPIAKMWKVLTCSFIGVAIILVGLLIYGISCNSVLNADVKSLKDSTGLLKRQIMVLNNKLLESKENTSHVIVDDKKNIYVVRHGDSFCKISKKMYGTEKEYKSLAKTNGLEVTSILHVGDTLIIAAN